MMLLSLMVLLGCGDTPSADAQHDEPEPLQPLGDEIPVSLLFAAGGIGEIEPCG